MLRSLWIKSRSFIIKMVWCSLTKKKLYNESQYKGRHPFFIVSSGRSGSTLLRKLLIQGGEVHIPPESGWIIPDTLAYFNAYSRFSWKKIVRDCLTMFKRGPDFIFWNLDTEELKKDLYHLPKEEQTAFSIIEHTYIAHLKRYNPLAKYYGDKTPALVMCLNELYMLYPKAKYIYMERNVRDVVSSRIKAFNEPIEQALERYKTARENINAFEQYNRKNILYIRYKDLVINTEDILKKICNFIDINFSKKMLINTISINNLGDTILKHHHSIKNSINTQSIGKWKRDLSETQKAKLEILLAKSNPSQNEEA